MSQNTNMNNIIPVEVDPFQLEEDSDYPSSSGSSVDIEEELIPESHLVTLAEASAMMSALAVLEETDDNSHIMPIIIGNPPPPMISAVPEEYEPQNHGLFMNLPLIQINIDPDEEIAIPETLSPVQDFTSNVTLHLEPVNYIAMENWADWSGLEEATDDIEPDEEVEVEPLPYQCAFNHALCLNYHGPPWLYSDEENDSDHTISNVTESSDSSTDSEIDLNDFWRYAEN